MLTKYIDAKVEYAEANQQICEGGQCSIVKTAAERPDDIFDGVKIKKNHAYLYVIAMGAGDYYSCFTKDNYFISAEGDIKTVDEIKPRDRVVSHDCSVNLVNVPIVKQWTGRFTKISARGIPDIECTSNHLFYALRREQIVCKRDKTKRCTPSTMQNSNICFRGNGCDVHEFTYKPEWIEAKDLKKGDFLLIPRKGMTKKNNHTWEPLHIDLARLIGFYLAEGSLNKHKNEPTSIRIAFHKDEKEFITEVEEIADRFGASVTKVVEEDKNTTTLIINSTHLASKIQEYCGEYADKINIAPVVFNQRDEFIRAMIGAYIDGDGHMAKDGRVTVRSSSKKWLLQLKQLLFRLGVINSWHWNDKPKTYKGSLGEVKPYGQVAFNYFDAKREFEKYSLKIRNSNYTPKAKPDSKCFVTDDYVFIPITSIETGDVETKTVYDANVERVHSYCVNFVAVHNSNRNGDFFWEKDLIQYHKKFLNAGVFIQHDNKDPNKSIGKVLKAIYNHKMHRVELLIEISRDKAPQIYDTIASGQRIAVSMGVKVPKESCSYCGKVTENSIANRCDHLKYHMHEIMPNGVKVFAINHPPLNFFDISIVRKPADHQGYAMFQKVASLEEYEPTQKQISFKEKVAGLRKMAELTKRIDAMAAFNPMSFKMVSQLRSTPKELLRNYILENDILLHPAEYIALFKYDVDAPKYELLKHAFEDPRNVRMFFQKVASHKPMKERKVYVKMAMRENEAMQYIKYRDLLVKEASKSIDSERDSFGNKILTLEDRGHTPTYQFNKFALIKAKIKNGDEFVYKPVVFGNLLDEALKSGVVEEIRGILPNGTELLLYKDN